MKIGYNRWLYYVTAMHNGIAILWHVIAWCRVKVIEYYFVWPHKTAGFNYRVCIFLQLVKYMKCKEFFFFLGFICLFRCHFEQEIGCFLWIFKFIAFYVSVCVLRVCLYACLNVSIFLLSMCLSFCLVTLSLSLLDSFSTYLWICLSLCLFICFPSIQFCLYSICICLFFLYLLICQSASMYFCRALWLTCAPCISVSRSTQIPSDLESAAAWWLQRGKTFQESRSRAPSC